ncbi:hypothetical protein DSO57_1000379 [Entomophthora muscae]|uniref:Uncharacterized protein n=1 Tax=Entomophthora muscae TaxID=34485 RepID=A0ACC2UIK5_9FUNG|nr:hypothetical protein DSO57_1000379 [Entomophthora muscae]
MDLFLKDTKASLPPQDVQKAHELQAANLFDFQFKKSYQSLPIRFKDPHTVKLHVIDEKKLNQLLANLTEVKRLRVDFYDAHEHFVPFYRTFKAQNVFLDWSNNDIWFWLANCFPNLTDLYIDFPNEFPEDELNPCILKSVKRICLMDELNTCLWRKLISNTPNLTQVLISDESQVTELAKDFPNIFFCLSSQYIKFNYDLEEGFYAMCSSEFESTEEGSDPEFE